MKQGVGVISSEVSAQGSEGTVRARRRWRRVRAAVIVALLVVGAGEFGVRGIARGIDSSADFGVVWTEARAWWEGRDPYRHEVLKQVWEERGGLEWIVFERQYTPALYPPSTFATLAPLAAMPWKWAKMSWLAANVGMTVLLLILLTEVAGLRRGGRGRDLREPLSRRAAIADWMQSRDGEGMWGSKGERAWLLVGLTLALAPVHANLAYGQLTLVSLTLGLLGWWASERGWGWWGGVSIGLAAALKPQIGMVVLAFAAYRGQWRAVVMAMAVAGAALGVGAARLDSQGIAWLSELKLNLYDNAHGGSGDPTVANPLRYQLLNLQYPLHNFTGNRPLVNAVTLALTGGAGLGGAVLALRGKREKDVLLLGLWLTASLLVVYHRSYDAVVLAVPLAWLLGSVATGSRVAAVVAGLGILVFLTPGAALVQVMADRWPGAKQVAESGLWRNWILPHQVWALVVLVLAELWLLGKRSRAGERESVQG